ncbi:MAG TPA: hypothetical protein DHM44_08520, partial [Flexistipes sinusarabici]|nr:hypothetical protein [Flexistipes sinusarabici]
MCILFPTVCTEEIIMKKLRKIRIIFFVIAAIWIASFISFTIYSKQEHLKHFYDVALEKAKEMVAKDKLLRRFISDVGGVYAPVSDKVQPNPYLNLPDKNIETKDGRTLTLLNPDYFTRLYYKHSNIENKHTKVSLVSLDSIKKANMPNDWERKALLKVKESNQAFVEIINKNNTSVFRYMSPLIMSENCMKCHGNSDIFAGTNNYKLGEIAGGLVVTLDYKPYLSLASSELKKAFIPVFVFFLAGIIIFFVSYKMIKKLTIEIIESGNKYMS